MEKNKWLVRSGTLVILVGFFMPTMLVSCSAMPGMGQSFSLAQLAGQAQQPVLYLLLLGAVVAGGASFLTATDAAQARRNLLVQVGAIGVGVVSVLITTLTLSSQIQQGGYQMIRVQPDIGAFILVIGVGLFAAGWAAEWREFQGGLPHVGSYGSSYSAPAPPGYDYSYDSPPARFPSAAPVGYIEADEPTMPKLPVAEAALKMISGAYYGQSFPVTCDNFTIGRHSSSHLQLQDPTVSRQHACLRYAEGAWFIQDADSAGGTYVNGEKVPAMRLSSGDKITIGESEFVFYC